MKDHNQIAAEAWKQIINRKLKYDLGDRAQFDSDCIAIIQSAIEKSTEQLRRELKATRKSCDNSIEAIEHACEQKLSRAAHASERWLKSARILAKMWAADDRRWTTQQEVECSLLAFASSLSQPAHASELKGQDDYTNWIRKDECQAAIEKATDDCLPLCKSMRESRAAHASDPWTYDRGHPDDIWIICIGGFPKWSVQGEAVAKGICEAANHPKPSHASEPWTAAKVDEISRSGLSPLQDIADAHNATLQPSHASEQGSDMKRLNWLDNLDNWRRFTRMLSDTGQSVRPIRQDIDAALSQTKEKE